MPPLVDMPPPVEPDDPVDRRRLVLPAWAIRLPEEIPLVLWESACDDAGWDALAGYEDLGHALDRLGKLARWAAEGRDQMPPTPIEWALVPGGVSPSRSAALVYQRLVQVADE
jgi:hypothetical protein